ncbi:hypothetical protein F2Q70_00012061 [Brassica cretica]|uniref:Uncharacterized protein n=1 Tax=Brassica cretica TaxID=69181 RepID=A0A8S9ME25_BRACR|nr:hypothetical protein F2Q70_00012061 [Brassica cretica]
MPLSVDRATRVSIDRHLTMSIDAHQQRSGAYELDQVSRDLRSRPTLIKMWHVHSGTSTVACPQKIKMDVESSEAWPLGHNTHTTTLYACHGIPAEVEYNIGTRLWPASERQNAKSEQNLRMNLRVPTWPQGSQHDPRKKIEPLCSLRRVGVITSLRTSGFPCDPGSKYKHQDPDTISGSMGKPQVLTRPQDPITTSGSNHDLKNLRVPSTVSDLNENLRVPLRPLGPRYDLTI